MNLPAQMVNVSTTTESVMVDLIAMMEAMNRIQYASQVSSFLRFYQYCFKFHILNHFHFTYQKAVVQANSNVTTVIVFTIQPVSNRCTFFENQTQTLIANSFLKDCDGNMDCRDFSDERYCRKY